MRTLGTWISLVAIGAALLLALPASGWAEPPVPPVAPAAEPLPGVVGQAPIAAGNTASARERALDEAFRQLVETTFTALLAELGAAGPSPGQASVRAAWLQKPRRLVRGYRVLEQSEEGGLYKVRVTADLDEAGMRRELDRARGASPALRGPVVGVVPVAPLGAPEAAAAIAAGLSSGAVRAEVAPGRFTDEDSVRAAAQKSGRGIAVAVAARDEDAGGVRGTGMHAWACEIAAKLVPATGDVGSERTAKAHGFALQPRDARASCYARAGAALAPTLLPDLGGAGASGDTRLVILDLDLNEPAVLSPLLRAARKLAGPAAVEVRRIAVGRVEIGVSTRLAAATLVAGLARELAAVATVVKSGGADRPDRISAQVRLVAPTLPPPAPVMGPVLPPAAVSTPGVP